jgi:hypothetical protein
MKATETAAPHQRKTPPCGGVQGFTGWTRRDSSGASFYFGKVQRRIQEAMNQWQAGKTESRSRLPIQ